MSGTTLDATLSGGTTRRLIDAVAGAIVLAVGMGFGRFAFTGMYALMIHDGVFDVAGGSLAASANYAGYLAGALIAGKMRDERAVSAARLAMAATVIGLALLAVPMPPVMMAVIRFTAGMLSAVTMVSASIWLFHVIDYHEGSPVLFAGVGTGIFLSAELIAAGQALGLHSAGVWTVLAVAAAVLAWLAWRTLSDGPEPGTKSHAHHAAAASGVGKPFSRPVLIAAYGLAGFGYIVTATYLPLLVRHSLGTINPVHVWAAFGLGAVPSCFVWHKVYRRLGDRTAMLVNLVVQAAGVVLPVIVASPVAYFASAALVGGTFMGTITIAMPSARRIAHGARFNLIAVMTAAFGVGQIAGPLVSTALFAHTHTFDASLSVAAAALAAAAVLCLV
ncbi:Sugar transporter [Pararobbsia alpina]|uniref:YbfB/YjiJ family MFS transporter n=1 Tax=Pararobbsia alpina TaxID=621374 RepID=UPI0039A59891